MTGFLKPRNLIRAAIIGAVIAIWAYIIFTPTPQLAIGSANGRYYSSCCGTITLQDGRMTLKNEELSYVIERGKDGPYLLPSGYVGASPYGGGFVVYPGGGALILPLDLDGEPATITLSSGRERYHFTRIDPIATSGRTLVR